MPEHVIARALRSLGSRDHAVVLDLLEDEASRGISGHGPRRLLFGRDDNRLDLLIHDPGPGEALQLRLRLTPPRRCAVRASCWRGDVQVVFDSDARTDVRGSALLQGLPRGLVSLRLDGPEGQPPLRSAWLRLGS